MDHFWNESMLKWDLAANFKRSYLQIWSKNHKQNQQLSQEKASKNEKNGLDSQIRWLEFRKKNMIGWANLRINQTQVWWIWIQTHGIPGFFTKLPWQPRQFPKPHEKNTKRRHTIGARANPGVRRWGLIPDNHLGKAWNNAISPYLKKRQGSSMALPLGVRSCDVAFLFG